MAKASKTPVRLNSSVHRKLNVEAVQVNVDHLLSRGLDLYYIKTLHSPLFSRLLFRLFVFLLILANLILVFVYFSVWLI